ncbi:MAG: phenylalanine--tRNA ligase subunit alpha [Pseudomonadota bacterium]|nr:phenylalanine--tRNA ligase subunit alpha [Pseudomonadota bacterium]
MKDIILQATELEKNALADIKNASSLQQVELIRVKYLGKSGDLTCLLRDIVKAPVAERKELGRAINIAKVNVMSALTEAKDYHADCELEVKLKQDKIDVTLPGTNVVSGSLHPITLAVRDLVSIFSSYGFSSVSGSEIEDDFHNFTALNIDELHPARAMHDTFYFSGDRLLRTHTSPAQIHTMLAEHPPLSMLSLGKVYRCDSDPTHSPMFHQLEGLVVSETCNFLELKSLIDNFFSIFFQRKIEVRFRPSYFPFTEPSAEVDIRMAKDSPWLEVMGCGMVHPNVFKHVKIDPEKYRGYAFGVGIDRLAMLKYGINDLRLFFENDIDFLAQF